MADAVYRVGMVAALEGMFNGRWVGLAMNGTELSAGGYMRVQVQAAGWNYSQGTRTEGGETIQIAQVTNASAIMFPTPSASQRDADEIILADAQNGGNVLIRFDIDNDPDAPASGDAVSIPAGSLVFSLDATAP